MSITDELEKNIQELVASVKALDDKYSGKNPMKQIIFRDSYLEERAVILDQIGNLQEELEQHKNWE